MDSLRDKIAQYLDEKFPEYDAASTYEAADAILALPEIADLQKKLAEVEVERDAYRDAAEHWKSERKLRERAYDLKGQEETLLRRAEAAEVRFIEQRDSLVTATKKLAKTEAKLAEVTAERDYNRRQSDHKSNVIDRMSRTGQECIDVWKARAETAEAQAHYANQIIAGFNL